MNYYWFNRPEILQKTRKNIPKKKQETITHKTKKLWKKSQDSVIKTCHKKKNTRLKSTKEKNIKNWFGIKKKRFFLNIKNEWEALKLNNIRLNKKEFYKSEELIDLMSVIVDQIVVSDKFKHNNEGFKYFFIGYLEVGIVKPLCIILPQMSGYIK